MSMTLTSGGFPAIFAAKSKKAKKFFKSAIDIYPKTDIIYMKSDIKEAVMYSERARIYAYLSAEITSLYHEAAVKMGISDTVLNILYVLCERDGKCLQSDIFRLTGISRQTINSAIRKLERDGLAYLEQLEGRNTMVCLTEKGRDFCTQKILPLFKIENKIWDEWTVDEQDKYILFTQKYRDSLKKSLREDL